MYREYRRRYFPVVHQILEECWLPGRCDAAEGHTNETVVRKLVEVVRHPRCGTKCLILDRQSCYRYVVCG